MTCDAVSNESSWTSYLVHACIYMSADDVARVFTHRRRKFYPAFSMLIFADISCNASTLLKFERLIYAHNRSSRPHIPNIERQYKGRNYSENCIGVVLIDKLNVQNCRDRDGLYICKRATRCLRANLLLSLLRASERAEPPCHAITERAWRSGCYISLEKSTASYPYNVTQPTASRSPIRYIYTNHLIDESSHVQTFRADVYC